MRRISTNKFRPKNYIHNLYQNWKSTSTKYVPEIYYYPTFHIGEKLSYTFRKVYKITQTGTVISTISTPMQTRLFNIN